MDWLLRPSHLDVPGSTLVAYVLLDVFLIVALARLLGNLMAAIGQPRVVGEILAGVLLGPTLLGADLSLRLAPQEARPALSSLATLGLILFMFLAGVEFDTTVLRGRIWQAGSLATLSVAIPAVLGFPVAFVMHNATYAGPQADAYLPFALFIGAALAVSAFPVTIHILMERGELNSPLGSLAVGTVGIVSILMFVYLGVAGAVASETFGHLLLDLALLPVFLVASFVIVRPALARALRDANVGGSVSGGGMAVVFGGMVLYGLIADRLGVNALVGGFLWGALLPADRSFRDAVSATVQHLAMVFFLPVFFALSGFSTDLRLLSSDTLPVTLVVLAAAVGGKFLAAAPARSMGLTWSQAGVIGALMNTRGLLVLVAGLIGLQSGIITVTTFTIIVVVALVTNLMTLPLLRWFSRRQEVPTSRPRPGTESSEPA